MAYIDPEEWLAGKTQWSIAKKNKYYQQLFKQLRGAKQKDFNVFFSTMVKSGETYTKTADQDVNDLSERPRNIFVPSKEGCGLLTYI